MRISSFSPTGASRIAAPSQLDASRKTARTSADPLALSPLGSAIVAAQQALRALPAVREGQVRELGSLLDSGRYQPSSDKIAQAMLATEGARASE